MDPDEIKFPFQRMTMFEGLEDYPDLLINPNSLREAYLAEVEAFLKRLKKGCRNNLIDYILVDTSQRFDVVLTQFLARRSGALR